MPTFAEMCQAAGGANAEGHGITIGSAQRLAKVVNWFENTPHDQLPQRRRPISVSQELIVGKVYDTTIAMRAQGYVEIWNGVAGSESDSGGKNKYWNMTSQTATKNCWCAIDGLYIIQVINPARIIEVTLTADLAVGGSSSNPTVHAFDDGHDPTDTDVIPTLVIWFGWEQQSTIKNGSKVRSLWNSVRQRYEALAWGC